MITIKICCTGSKKDGLGQLKMAGGLGVNKGFKNKLGIVVKMKNNKQFEKKFQE